MSNRTPTNKYECDSSYDFLLQESIEGSSLRADAPEFMTIEASRHLLSNSRILSYSKTSPIRPARVSPYSDLMTSEIARRSPWASGSLHHDSSFRSLEELRSQRQFCVISPLGGNEAMVDPCEFNFNPIERPCYEKDNCPEDNFIYQVHFKRAHRNFVLGRLGPRSLKSGDIVKVEGDRGEDLGIVVSKLPREEFQEFVPTAGYRGRGFCSGQSTMKFILRLASSQEKTQLFEKVVDEEIALQTIRAKVEERCLPMQILDAEYQFDRHKLVFFFDADRRIDFRDLVSELFSQFKTRIWMQQVDTKCLPDQDIRTEISKRAGFLASSYPFEQFEKYRIAKTLDLASQHRADGSISQLLPDQSANATKSYHSDTLFLPQGMPFGRDYDTLNSSRSMSLGKNRPLSTKTPAISVHSLPFGSVSKIPNEEDLSATTWEFGLFLEDSAGFEDR